jgi:hypothetical protein
MSKVFVEGGTIGFLSLTGDLAIISYPVRNSTTQKIINLREA